MARITETRKDNRKVGDPKELEIRAAMGKTIRELKRRKVTEHQACGGKQKIVGCPQII